MKLVLFLLFLSVASAAVFAMDLPSLARREKARRAAAAGRPVRSFGDADLERYHQERSAASTPPRLSPPPAPPARAWETERRRWRKETERHQRELSRIDANIRRLQWRLSDRRSRRRNGDRLGQDPTIALLEDSIENLKEERNRLEERFRERARRDGALPGWLR